MAKKKGPEELENIWDDEIKAAWDNLNAKQQAFLVEWLTNGFNASEANRQIYDKLAKNATSAASGSRRLANVNIQLICGKLSEDKLTDTLSIKNVYRDAMQAETPVFGDGELVGTYEDHKTRVLGANSLAKYNGQLEFKQEVNHSGELKVLRLTDDEEGL